VLTGDEVGTVQVTLRASVLDNLANPAWVASMAADQNHRASRVDRVAGRGSPDGIRYELYRDDQSGVSSAFFRGETKSGEPVAGTFSRDRNGTWGSRT
jgi:hypothetical protein